MELGLHSGLSRGSRYISPGIGGCEQCKWLIHGQSVPQNSGASQDSDEVWLGSLFLGCSLKSVVFKFFKIFISERARETETGHKWGRGRERKTQNLKQALGSELSAQSLTWGSNP